MTNFQNVLLCFIIGIVWNVEGESSFAGSSISSDPSGTRSVIVTGKNGGGGGVIQTRFGGGGSAASVGGGPVGTYASAGNAHAFAGPGGAYAGPGGAYAGPGPWGFPYWNGGGAYASASAGAPGPYYPPYPYDPYGYGPDADYPSGGYGVYSSSDPNGIQTRFANVPPGGQATIVEQHGNEAPKVYTYRGSTSSKNVDTIEK